jgi:hypothetical protein
VTLGLPYIVRYSIVLSTVTGADQSRRGYTTQETDRAYTAAINRAEPTQPQ